MSVTRDTTTEASVAFGKGYVLNSQQGFKGDNRILLL